MVPYPVADAVDAVADRWAVGLRAWVAIALIDV